MFVSGSVRNVFGRSSLCRLGLCSVVVLHTGLQFLCCFHWPPAFLELLMCVNPGASIGHLICGNHNPGLYEPLQNSIMHPIEPV